MTEREGLIAVVPGRSDRRSKELQLTEAGAKRLRAAFKGWTEAQKRFEAAEPLWFLGTVARLLLTGADTHGRFALWEGLMPRGAAPPLHSHPQDETFLVLDGRLSAWLVPPRRPGRTRMRVVRWLGS